MAQKRKINERDKLIKEIAEKQKQLDFLIKYETEEISNVNSNSKFPKKSKTSIEKTVTPDNSFNDTDDYIFFSQEVDDSMNSIINDSQGSSFLNDSILSIDYNTVKHDENNKNDSGI